MVLGLVFLSITEEIILHVLDSGISIVTAVFFFVSVFTADS